MERVEARSDREPFKAFLAVLACVGRADIASPTPTLLEGIENYGARWQWIVGGAATGLALMTGVWLALRRKRT